MAGEAGDHDAGGECVEGVAEEGGEDCADACADEICGDAEEGCADGGMQAGLGDDDGGDGGPHGALKVEEVEAEDGEDAGECGFAGDEEGLDGGCFWGLGGGWHQVMCAGARGG